MNMAQAPVQQRIMNSTVDEEMFNMNFARAMRNFLNVNAGSSVQL